MRKIITGFTCILFLFVSTGAYGQIKRFALGYEKGLSLVSMRGNSILNAVQKSRLSFSAGIFFQYNITKNFAIRTNISFERKGYSIPAHQGADSTGNPATVQTVARFDYLSLPVMVRANFGNKYRFFINAGPYIAYLIGQADLTKINGKKTTGKNIDWFKKTDAGISGGAGVEIPFKKFMLSLEIRDNLGLTNISKLPVVSAGTIKTNALNLLIAAHKK